MYNRQFKIGFAITIADYAILNVLSYVWANWQTKTDGINFANHYNQGPFWGVPFYWFGYSDWMFEDGFLGLVLNFVVIVGSAFIFGLLFRGLHNRLS